MSGEGSSSNPYHDDSAPFVASPVMQYTDAFGSDDESGDDWGIGDEMDNREGSNGGSVGVVTHTEENDHLKEGAVITLHERSGEEDVQREVEDEEKRGYTPSMLRPSDNDILRSRRWIEVKARKGNSWQRDGEKEARRPPRRHNQSADRQYSHGSPRHERGGRENRERPRQGPRIPCSAPRSGYYDQQDDFTYDDPYGELYRERVMRRQQPRKQSRKKSRGCCGHLWSTTFIVSLILGLILSFGWPYMAFLTSSNPSFRLTHAYRFAMQQPGYELVASTNVTEQELESGLFEDVPLTRLAVDLKEYIKEGPFRTCMCMHHLTFMPVRNSQDIVPRRLCVVYNKKREESEVMINPVAVGRSSSARVYLEKSLSCGLDDTPIKVARPEKLWVEWEDTILDFERPAGSRMRTNRARFSGAEAACLALALEELDGMTRCNKATPPTVPEKKVAEPKAVIMGVAPDGTKRVIDSESWGDNPNLNHLTDNTISSEKIRLPEEHSSLCIMTLDAQGNQQLSCSPDIVRPGKVEPRVTNEGNQAQDNTAEVEPIAFDPDKLRACIMTTDGRGHESLSCGEADVGPKVITGPASVADVQTIEEEAEDRQ